MLTERYQDAMGFAFAAHRTQTRKGTSVPYLAHLLAVSALVLEYGGGEDEAIGALLHDAAEDQGGASMIETIRARFGATVADIVAGCSDSLGEPKPAWRARKETYVAHLGRASKSIQLVAGCDKLHNARAIVRDLHRDGILSFDQLAGGRDGTLWYYAALVETVRAAPAGSELARVVTEMHQLAANA